MAWTWGGDGSVATVEWGGRSWTLDLTARNPGLVADDIGPLLALNGLASPGRRDTSAFSGASLRSVERRFGRIEATYTPDGWGDLRLRASWKLHEADTIDLEIQLSAQSVDELRQLEVIVSSVGRRETSEPPRRWVQARDARAAMLSYDGREADLDRFATLPIDQEGFRIPRIMRADPLNFLEMVHPDDVTRRILEDIIDQHMPMTCRYGLFGYDLEKGVVVRGRLRGAWVLPQEAQSESTRRMAEFLREPPPLGP